MVPLGRLIVEEDGKSTKIVVLLISTDNDQILVLLTTKETLKSLRQKTIFALKERMKYHLSSIFVLRIKREN